MEDRAMGPLVGDVSRGETQLSLFTQVTLSKSLQSGSPVPASERGRTTILPQVVWMGGLAGRSPPHFLQLCDARVLAPWPSWLSGHQPR